MAATDTQPKGVAEVREALKRLDRVLAFARKLRDDTGNIPQGLADDFQVARALLEKTFVLHFDAIDETTRKRLRDFVKAAKKLTRDDIQEHTVGLSKRTRSLLNALLIHNEATLSLDDDGFEIEYTPPAPPTPESPTIETASTKSRTPWVILAVGVALAIASVSIVGWQLGWFNPSTTIAHSNDANDAPANRPSDNTPVVVPENDGASDEELGYTATLRVNVPTRTLDPLTVPSSGLRSGDVASLLLGLEDLIATVEPDRLEYSPERTRELLGDFALQVTRSEPRWRASKKQFLEAFVGFAQDRLKLAHYPDSNNVLLSDVLNASGGPRATLIATYTALANVASAPLILATPNGLQRPILAQNTKRGTYTFNATALGLRDREVSSANVALLIADSAWRLRESLKKPEARHLMGGVKLQMTGTLTETEARSMLADFNPMWLVEPPEDTPRSEFVVYETATFVLGHLMSALLASETGGAVEALKLYRLAESADDADRAKQALALLNARVQPGAVENGVPVAMTIGDTLVAEGREIEAISWFQRAFDEFPDDPRPALRLAKLVATKDAPRFWQAAYVRGDRDPTTLRHVVAAYNADGEHLAALAIADELLETKSATTDDVRNTALLCLTLGRVDWALARIRANPDDALLRLELICELSENGLSDTAQELAAKWRETGTNDTFVDELLRRHGG